MAVTVALPLEGGCQCGALRYELKAPPLTIMCCHCANCQKQSGGAFVLSALIPEAALIFTKGEAATTEWTADSGNQRYGRYCRDCGSRIANGQTPSSGIFSLRAGTFDETGWVRPAGHIWMKSAQPWMQFAEDDLRYDGQPSDYAPLIERFRSFGFFA